MKIKALSDLEQEVMQIIWENDSSSVRDVLKKISETKELAYTTVATVLSRLQEKGLLTRNDKDFAILYSPKISKEDYSKSIAGSFFNKLFQSFGDIAIASFAESIEELPKEKKKYFLELLEKHNENK